MNDVGGCDSGTGLRAGKSSRSSADANFEPYDDSEWDVGIGNLIIDLDADIEKNTEQQSTDTNRLITSPASSTSSSSSPTPNQMHIPTNAAAPPSSTSVGNSSSTTGGSTSTNSSGGKANSSKSSSSSSSSSSGSSTKHAGSADMEHSAVVDKGLKMKIKRKPGTKSGSEVKHEIVKNDSLLAASNLTNSSKNSSSDSSSSGKSAHHHSSSSSSKNNLINSENDSHGVVNNNGVTSKESNKESLNSNNDSGGGGGGGGSKKTSNRKGSKDTKDGGNGRGEGNKKVKNSGGSGGGGSTKSIKGDANTSNNSSDVTNSNKSHHGKESLSSTTATVSLNVPTIVPGGSSSSAFGKVNSSTLKVPQSNSTTSSNLSLQQHSSSSDSSSGRTCSGSGNNNNSGNTSSHLSSWNSSSTSSPSSKGDGTSKNLVDKVQNNTNNTSGVSLSSYSNKKGKNSFSNSSEKLGGEIDGLNSSGGGHFNSSNSSRSASALTTSSPNVTDLSVGGGTSVNHHQGISMSHHHQHQSLNAKGRPSTQDVCVGTSVGTVTEPDCLGPCEPGTSVTLEGIVWHETESGVLVVNVTWRGKTYVGTLLDCTKSEWAPPRFCDSPTSDLEMRLPKNRGKRGGRGQQSTPVNELTSAADAAAALLQQGLGSGGSLGLSGAGNGGNGRPGQNPKLRNGAKGRRGSAAAGTSAAAAAASFITPASPMKGQNSNSDNSLPKRKTRGSETESANDDLPVSSKNAKRPKMLKDKTPGSPSSVLDGDSKSGPSSPALIECPEPNCSKKYKHINGLRYHQSHAHCVVAEDSDSNASTTSNAKEAVTPTIDTPGGSADSNNSAVVIDGELESMDTTNGSSETAGSGETAMDVDKSEEPLVKNLSSKNSGGSSSKKEVESVGDSKEVSPGVSRAPILTVPVPYISLQGRNAMSGGDVLKVVGSTPKGNASGGVPWQPHHHGVQGQVGGGGSGGGMVSLNIPMSGESKSKDKNGGEGKSGKTKHKKSKKEKEKKQQGQDSGSPSKSEQCGGSGGGRGGSTPGGLFGSSSSVQRDSVSSEDNEVRMVVGGGSAGDASGGRLGVLEDPQSPAYSDISDANDSGDAVELTTVGKDLKSPPDLLQQKKDLHVPLHGIVPQPPATQHQPPPQLSHPQQQGLHGPPPPGMSPFYPAFYNPYTNLEPPNSKLGGDKGDEGMMDKGMKVPPGQQPGMKGPPPPQQQPPPGQPPSSGDVDGSRGRSPKLDFHPKYLSQQHFFHYPYSNYHFDGSHGQYGGMMGGGGGGNGGPPDGPGNAFNPHGRGGPGVPAFGLMEHEKEKEHLEKEKDGGIPLGMNIKQEPGEKMHHKDTGRHSSHLKSSEMMEKDRMGLLSDIKTEYGMSPSDFSSGGKSGGGHFGPIGCSKHGGSSSSGKDSSGKREESKGSSDSNKKESEEKDRKESEGKGPTMETTGPPPPPTAGTGFAYLPQPYNPFGLHFDPGHPLYRQVIVPGPFGGPPYMHPHAGGIPRFQPPPPPPSGPPGSGGGPPGGMPEDLSRASVGGANPGGPPPGGPTAKALDMLQHHAQYYQVHKIHELSERALKSPSPQVVQQRERPDRSDAPTAPPQPPSQPQSSSSSVNPTAASPGGGSSSSSRNLVKGGPADLSNKDPNSSKMNIGCVNESSRSPPTQHHVHSHTHHHTHVGIGYPIIPAFSAPHSPHFGVIPTAPPTAASVIPPFPTPKPN